MTFEIHSNFFIHPAARPRGGATKQLCPYHKGTGYAHTTRARTPYHNLIHKGTVSHSATEHCVLNIAIGQNVYDV